MRWNNDLSLPFIIFSCLALYLVNLQVIPIDIMEARNFISAREMLQDGNWFHTTLNGFPRYEKPPLPTWITAVFGGIFGLHTWALRLPAALIALCSFYFLYKITLALHLRKEIAKLSILVASTSFYILFSGKNGQWDIYTHGFAIIGIWYTLNLFQNDSKNLKHTILAGVFFGFSILSKGPVGIYALVLPFLITYLLIYRKDIQGRKWWYVGLTVIVSLVIGTSWYVATYLSNPDKVLGTMAKESGNWTSYNVRPFYYYWSFFTQSGIWSLTALLAIITPLFRKVKWRHSKHKFSYVWTLLSLLLLSLIPEKKSRYLLPVLFPLAITVAVSIYYMLLHKFSKERWIKINIAILKYIPYFVSAILLVVVVYLLITEEWTWYTLCLIGLGITPFIVYKITRKTDRLQPSLYTYSILCIALVWFGLPYAFTQFTNKAYQPVSAVHSYEKQFGINTISMSNPTPEFVWDYGFKINVFDSENEYPITEDIGVLVKESEYDLLLNTFEGRSIEHLTRLDMNQSNEGTGSHRSRLYIDYYLVKAITD